MQYRRGGPGQRAEGPRPEPDPPIWLKERPGEPSGAGAQRRGRPELVGAEG